VPVTVVATEALLPRSWVARRSVSAMVEVSHHFLGPEKHGSIHMNPLFSWKTGEIPNLNDLKKSCE